MVVFLHGVAGSRLTYNWVPESVAGHRVIRPDFRGHGAAARTPGSYRISDYVEDVIEVLRAEGPAILVGHSLGGVAAWSVAQQAPELVRGAFLEDPPLYRASRTGTRQPRDPALRRTGGACAALAGGPGSARPTPRRHSRPSPRRRANEDALAARAYALLHLDPGVMDTVIDGSLLASTDVSSPVEVPVCVLAAGATPAFCPDSEERLGATHPRVQVVRVEGAGHSIHDERAFRDEYFARVEAFVASA